MPPLAATVRKVQMPRKTSLSPKERLFAERYNIHRNGQRAAEEAGYTPSAARQTAYRLLRRPVVAAYITELQTMTSIINQLEACDVMQALAAKVRFDIRRLYDADGNIKPVHELDDETARIITEYETREQYHEGALVGITHRVKVPDNMAAINAAMRHFGLFEKDNGQQPGIDGLRELFELAANNPLTPRQDAALPAKRANNAGRASTK